jgi:3-carboxy-cis,cis-muconate cycloisomerase
MRANFDITQGLALSESIQMALAPRLGRLAAHDLVHQACMRAQASAEPIAKVLGELDDGRVQLDEPALAALLAPQNYLGQAQAIIDRCIAAARKSLDRLGQAIRADRAQQAQPGT